MHRSYSQLAEWSSCGKQYELHRVHQVAEAPATWLISGIAFHRTVEAWERAGRTLTVETWQSIYVSEFAGAFTGSLRREPDLSRWLYGGRGGAQADLDRRAEAGQEWVATYIRHALADDWQIYELPDGTPAVEVAFRLTVPGPDGPVDIIGSIDQVLTLDGRTPGRIRDLKSGSKAPVGWQQLALYRLAWIDLFGEDPREGDYYLARKGETTPAVDLSFYTLDDLTRDFRALETAIGQGIYLPNPGDLCRPCGVAHACPIFGKRVS